MTATVSLLDLNNIAALRLNAVTTVPYVFVMGYNTVADRGEGVFKKNAADTTSADNGVTIIVDSLGQRWYRQGVGQRLTMPQCGAVGDGATDDTAAITRFLAVATSPGWTLEFPAASYYIASPITVPQASTTFLLSLGAVLLANPSLSAAFITSTGQNFSFLGGAITNASAQTSISINAAQAEIKGTTFSQTSGIAISFSAATDCLLTGVRVLSSAATCVNMNAECERISMVDSLFYTSSQYAIILNAPVGCVIANNIIQSGSQIGIEVVSPGSGNAIGPNVVNGQAPTSGFSSAQVTALTPSVGNVISMQVTGNSPFTVTLTANCTLDVSTTVQPGFYCTALLMIKQGGSGSFEITSWPSNFIWAGGFSPEFSTSPGAVDWLQLVSIDGGATWYAVLSSQFPPVA